MDNVIGFLILGVSLGIFVYIIIMTKRIKDELRVKLEKVVRETVKEEIDNEIKKIKDVIPALLKSNAKNIIPSGVTKFLGRMS